MNPERWQRIEQLYHEASAQPSKERAAFLAETCGADEALRAEVQSLLDRSGLDSGWLNDGPALVPAADLALRAGRRLGVYEIRGLLGAGGMGEVHRAYDTRLGREVAIKVLPQLVTHDPERLSRFEREARMLASLNHANIGAIYGVEDNATESGERIRTLVLELVEGPTLADRISRVPLNTADATAIAIQITNALEAAHGKGIVHRDIKPANVKVTSDGIVKVLDFGLAKATSDRDDAPDGSPAVGGLARDTRAGAVLGTVAYMSPEQALRVTHINVVLNWFEELKRLVQAAQQAGVAKRTPPVVNVPPPSTPVK